MYNERALAAACVAGMTAQEAGDMPAAIAHFERAVALAPDALDVRLLLAFALGASGHDERVRTVLGDAPDIDALQVPDARRLADAAIQLGATLVALRITRRLVQLTPHDADLTANFGALLHRTGDMHEAGHVLHRAIMRWPNHVPSLLNNANLSASGGGHDEALRDFDRALRVAPSHAMARWHRGMLRLTMGDFHGGWQDHEARRSLPVHTVKVPANSRTWNGRNAAGRTLLLWGEQGLGDQIQGVRFATTLADLGANVVVQCATPLVPLFETVRGVSRVVADTDTPPACDAHVPMLSVPFLLKMHNEQQFDARTYIRLPNATQTQSLSAAPHVRTELDPRQHTQHVHSSHAQSFPTHVPPARVGVAWAGSPGHINDANRSLSTTQLRTLLDGVSARWISLQVGARANDLTTLGNSVRERVVDVSSSLTNFLDTAHVLTALDRLVTVDTAVAHLAGAMGVPTLLLVPFVPDWRWQLMREDSPWYASVRIIRQPSVGDWTSAIAAAHSELSAGGHARAA